ALFRAFQKFLNKNKMAGAVRLTDNKGRVIDYGRLLDSTQDFSKTYPSIADLLRECNKRRNGLPSSHPYNYKGDRTRLLSKREQSDIVKKLKKGYEEIIKIVDNCP
ncbi:MAG: hypothetical protein MUO33_13145, partial [Sedimentisphaerales bacterium]|nr:hypothetical protein [Sedimentisphaerales bacterium]